jgi:hypothetical protein|tara:strand:- start:796 stop:963 length:168 start_codon:yes stop_codon:yes gene_type:complete
MQIIGYIIIAFAVADFGMSYAGINLTPFLPPQMSQYSAMAFAAIGYLFVYLGKKN